MPADPLLKKLSALSSTHPSPGLPSPVGVLSFMFVPDFSRKGVSLMCSDVSHQATFTCVRPVFGADITSFLSLSVRFHGQVELLTLI